MYINDLTRSMYLITIGFFKLICGFVPPNLFIHPCVYSTSAEGLLYQACTLLPSGCERHMRWVRSQTAGINHGVPGQATSSCLGFFILFIFIFIIFKNIFYWLCYYSCPIFPLLFPSTLHTPSHQHLPLTSCCTYEFFGFCIPILFLTPYSYPPR